MAWLGIGGRLLLRYLVAVNVVEFTLFAWDKLQAQHKGWRVAERELLLVAFLGGTPAAFFASRFLCHKRRKKIFMDRLRTIVLLQVFFLGYIVYYYVF
jgi:uncharacterized membrane protein YsdA (DUF1294 family)